MPDIRVLFGKAFTQKLGQNHSKCLFVKDTVSLSYLTKVIFLISTGSLKEKKKLEIMIVFQSQINAL